MHGETPRLEPKTILEKKAGTLSYETHEDCFRGSAFQPRGSNIRLSSGSTSSRHDNIGPLNALIAPRIRQALAAKLAKQLRFPLFGILQVPIPNVSIAADLFGKGCEFH